MLQRTCIVVLSIFVISSFAIAQQPRYNAFVGYSFQLADVNGNGRYDHLHGGEGSFEMHFLPLVSLVVDASGHFGPADLVIPQNGIIHVHEREYVFLVGPRVSFQTGRYRPFAHALFGVARVHFSASGFSDDEMNFSTALGGGLDYRIRGPFQWRAQADYLLSRFFSSTQHNGRFSTGLVFTF